MKWQQLAMIIAMMTIVVMVACTMMICDSLDKLAAVWVSKAYMEGLATQPSELPVDIKVDHGFYTKSDTYNDADAFSDVTVGFFDERKELYNKGVNDAVAAMVENIKSDLDITPEEIASAVKNNLIKD